MNQPNILILHLDELRQTGRAVTKPGISRHPTSTLCSRRRNLISEPLYWFIRLYLISLFAILQSVGEKSACCMGQPLYIALRLSDFSKAPAVKTDTKPPHRKMHMTPTYLDIGFSDLEWAEEKPVDDASRTIITTF